MSKEFVPTERNIEKLLKKLSADNKPYPKSLLDTRRATYMSQVISVVSSGPHFGKGNGQIQAGTSTASAPMTPIMKAVLTALVAGNIALATYLAVSIYKNWDKVQEMLFGAPSISETSPVPPEILTQAPELATTPEIVISPEGAVNPVSTPEPNDFSDDSQLSGSDSTDSSQVSPSEPEVSTPEPNGDVNPGLHLGQTPHGPDNPPGQDSQNNNQSNPQDNKSNQGNPQNNN